MFHEIIGKKDFKHIEYYTSWIYKICENIALRKLNQETIERKKLQSEENGFIEESDLAIFGSLQESVEKLDKDSQAIFYLHYVESYRLKEIAEIINMTYENVRQKHHRGIKFLRKSKKVSHKILLRVFL